MNPPEENNPNPPTLSAPTSAPEPSLVNGDSVPKTVISPTQSLPVEEQAELPVAAHMAGPPPAAKPLRHPNPDAAFAAPPALTPSPSPLPNTLPPELLHQPVAESQLVDGGSITKTVVAPTQPAPLMDMTENTDDVVDQPHLTSVAQPVSPPPPVTTPIAGSDQSGNFAVSPANSVPSALPPGNVPILTQSQILATVKPERDLKKFIKPAIQTGVGLVFIGIILAILVATNIIGLGKLKSITYDNAKGDTYKLKFYSKYSTKDISGSESPAGEDGLKMLVSKTSYADKYPITLIIQGAGLNSSSDTSYNGLKDCGSAKKAFEVEIKSLEQTVNVCSVEFGGLKDVMYIGVFKDENKAHVFWIMPDADFKSVQSDPKKAAELITKTSLKEYQDDLQEILSSIEPVKK
jgi:hypothetical protein